MEQTIGVVILNYNDAPTTISILQTIYNYSNISNIVVVDNNSTDNSFELLYNLQKRLNFELLSTVQNGGYSYGNNIGLKHLIEKHKVDISIIANPDVIFEDTVLLEIKKVFDHDSKTGLVSPIMLDPEGKESIMWLSLPTYIEDILSSFFIGRYINRIINRARIHHTSSGKQKVEILPGSFLAFRSKTLKDINYLDENVFLYYEENIIGEKMKKIGMDTVLLTNCSYIHNHSVTIKKNINSLNRIKCLAKSRMYYATHYQNLGSLQKTFLNLMCRYDVWEASILLKLRSLINKL